MTPSLPQSGRQGDCHSRTRLPLATWHNSRARGQLSHLQRRAHQAHETSCKGCRGIRRLASCNSTAHSSENRGQSTTAGWPEDKCAIILEDAFSWWCWAFYSEVLDPNVKTGKHSKQRRKPFAVVCSIVYGSPKDNVINDDNITKTFQRVVQEQSIRTSRPDRWMWPKNWQRLPNRPSHLGH